MPGPFKEISDNHGRLHPSKRKRVLFFRIMRLDAIQREIQNMVTSYCSFWDGISLVRPESKLSRSWSRSRYFQAGVGVS